jgi:hypothetical protein
VSPRRGLWALAAVAVLALSTWEAAGLYRFYLGQTRLPLWDMAGHGWGGVELLRALSAGRPLHFLDLLNRQDKWPFGFSLLLLPFLAAGHAGFASATLLSTVLFALVPLLMLWVAGEVDSGAAGFWGGLLGGALFLSSPLPRIFGILVMRETAGVFFSLLALGLYLRARRLGTPWAWRLMGLAFLALVLVKYNYALMFGLAALANEVWRLAPEPRRELGRRAVRFLSRRIVLALWLGLLILAVPLGINPGVGIYAGLVVGAAGLAVPARREAFRNGWRTLPVEARAILATVAIPLWLWCLSPSPIHPKNMMAFLRNRSAGPPLFSSSSLLFYFRSLARDYAPTPVAGGLLVASLILSLLASLIWLWKGRDDEPFRVLFLMVFLGLTLTTLHPFKEPRFFATTAPFAMLLAGIAFSRFAHLVPGRGAILGGLLCALTLAGLASAAREAGLEARLAGDYKLYSGRPGFWRPLAFLADHAAGARRLAVIGTFNELSDSLVRWWLAVDEETRGVEVVRPASRRRVRDWLAEERPDRILAIRLLPSSRFYGGRDFQLYNAWQLRAISALETDPAWRVSQRKVFEGLGMEVLVMEPPAQFPLPERSPSPRRP